MSFLNTINKSRKKHGRIEFAVIILFLFMLVLFFSKPAVVGYASTNTHKQHLNIPIQQSQSFFIKTIDGSNTILTSLRISGEIQGPGLVSAYIINNQNQEYLLFHNIKKGYKNNFITGNIVGSEATTNSLLPEKGPILKLVEDKLIDDFPKSEGNYETFNGFFEKTCYETCLFDKFQFKGNQFKIIFFIEPNTSLTVNDLSYTTLKE